MYFFSWKNSYYAKTKKRVKRNVLATKKERQCRSSEEKRVGTK